MVGEGVVVDDELAGGVGVVVEGWKDVSSSREGEEGVEDVPLETVPDVVDEPCAVTEL